MKKLIMLCAVLVFISSFLYNFDFVKRINPEGTYETQLTLTDYNTSREHYVILREIKGDTALISIENNGQHMVQEGDIIHLDGYSQVKEFEGYVQVNELKEDSIKLLIDIERTTGFYTWNMVLVGVLSGMLAYGTYCILKGIYMGVSKISQVIKDRMVENRRSKFKVL